MPIKLEWDYSVVVWLALAGAGYAACLRSHANRHGVPAATRRQIIYFALGLFTLWAAQGTPLDGLADDYLFSAHMLQHVLITFVAPPLLLLGAPDWMLRPAFRAHVLGRVLRVLTHPVAGLVLFNVLFSLYHVPGIYEAGLHNDTLHFFQHVVLFVTALLMWWPLLSPLPEAPPLSDPLQLLYIFIQLVLETIVFALVTFAPEPFYPTYIHAPRLWGLTALDDQQIGGAIMKIVVLAALVPFIASAFSRWVKRESDTTPESRADVAARYRAAYHRSRADAARPSRTHRTGLRVIRGSRSSNQTPRGERDL